MTWSIFHRCHGNVNLVCLKRGYSLKGEQPELLAKAPKIVETPHVQDNVLLVEPDIYPKLHFTDLVVKGSVHAPAGRSVTELNAGIKIGDAARSIRAIGQRRLKVSSNGVSFSPPEPFSSVPMSWLEAYGGDDRLNVQAGDLWDAEAMTQAMGSDMSDMNLCRYRRNPVGKGFLLKLTRDHDDYPLPRLEHPHSLLTPNNIETGDPLRWLFQPSPACFGWIHYPWFPRICFSAGKLFPKLEQNVPAGSIPETDFGYSRDDLFKPVSPQELVLHPRAYNGAHPLMQAPSLKGKLDVTLQHLDPNRPLFKFRFNAVPPVVRLKMPGDHKTYRETGFLSQMVFNMEEHLLTATWHAIVRTRVPALGEETVAKIEWDVLW